MTHIRFIRRVALVLAPSIVVVALACREDTESPTAPEAGPALAATASTALSFRQVSAGWFHTCGTTTNNLAYCWGENVSGKLGDGATTSSSTPVAVAGGLPLRRVTAGTGHSCSITTGEQAYCWGANFVGQLGNGTTNDHLTPVAVAGGLRFLQLTADNEVTCGVTLEERAYCWGGNFVGQLGDGTTANRLRPVAVVGGRRFLQVSTSGLHTCGVTPANELFCWGDNRGGQLGDGTTTNRLKPVRVHAFGLQFRQVSAGFLYTCAVTLSDVAYCWGQNDHGRLGNGTFSQSKLGPSPGAKVRGGIRFRAVSADLFNACGVTPENLAYCWGFGGFLGDGTTTDRRTPVPVVGGLHFLQVSVGEQHTCGVTTGNVAYCWGVNGSGELGDGTTMLRVAPVAVVPPALSIRATR